MGIGSQMGFGNTCYPPLGPKGQLPGLFKDVYDPTFLLGGYLLYHVYDVNIECGSQILVIRQFPGPSCIAILDLVSFTLI